ncbi:MAG TPA: excinuclease ABC subunit UvrC [Gammaproteobacteria bacterium]|nr:excinuclease ABC subunit UvrC [Gammaproteobacteria bacterium]
MSAHTFDSERFLQSLSTRPGIYKMLSAEGDILYIGKARNLKARVGSYFRNHPDSPRIQAMVAQIADIEVTITHNETEALLLENNLIKQHKPRYNVYLRDDKSYPYIYLSGNHLFPRLSFDRGKRQGSGRYFGPYPSASAVRQTLGLVQKLFRLRQCEDTFFRNRSRPCLQYQIKRCTAPCVGLIDEPSYRRDVEQSVMLLEGKTSQVTDLLVERMDEAARRLDYEAAASCRDRIQFLRKVYDKQYVSGEKGDFDIVACELKENTSCVQVFYIRDGRNLGSKTFFPRTPAGASRADVLEAFLEQYYLQHQPAGDILVDQPIEDRQPLEQLLSERAGRKITIQQPRGERATWLKLAATNARNALQAKLASQQNTGQRFEDLQQLLELESLPERMECFDVSHTQGEATVAACVVFDGNGPVKSEYRRFNIDGVTPGDDYGALSQALTRRYTRLKKGEGKLPDILFIDGGKGQLGAAAAVLEELQVPGVAIVGIAKGPDRIPGQERLLVAGGDKVLTPDANRPGFLLIQAIRDEAHRFAISGHRLQRKKARTRSVLEDIHGLGGKRRQLLLRHFGGMQGLQRAGVEDIAAVKGIGREMAGKIYATLHGENH